MQSQTNFLSDGAILCATLGYADQLVSHEAEQQSADDERDERHLPHPGGESGA